MPIDTTHSKDYADGKAAFERGLNLSDKPAHLLRSEWDAGWHDALAVVVRALLKAAWPLKP